MYHSSAHVSFDAHSLGRKFIFSLMFSHLSLYFILFLCREVEDFARRLNSVWPERMQELLSLGPGRKLVPISINGNGSMGRYTGRFLPQVSVY
jgi:hypothetical protein